jgi:hypothetical protein
LKDHDQYRVARDSYRHGTDLLFLFESIAKVEDLDLYLALPLMVQNALVWLTLLVAHAVMILWIGCDAIPRAHVGEVLLDITRGTTTTGSGKTDVVGHVEVKDLFGQVSLVQY